MKLNRKLLVVALATALPWMSAYAQSPSDLQKEIELLKGQLKMLSEKIEAMSAKVDPTATAQQITRLEQKIDLAEDDSIKAGFKGMKFKGSMEAVYLNDSSSTAAGFDKTKGNGGYGAAMFEISKEPDVGIGWTLRLVPLSSYGTASGTSTSTVNGVNDPVTNRVTGTANGTAAGSVSLGIVHEATVSIPVGEHGAKINAGLTPDYSGYEYSMGNQNPLITNNLLYSNLAASNYMGAGMSYVMGNWTGKWMIGQVDGVMSRKTPGLAYRGDYSMGEYSGLGFSGVHFRTNDENLSPGTNADLMEIDGYYTRGDLSLQGQFSFGKVLGGAMDGSGADAKWWGVSGFAGYKVTPRLQTIARFDFVSNRDNGGGVYFSDGSYGPELDSMGAVIDSTVGANRYALSLGTNYVVNANTQWKTELRFDRSSGYNFMEADGVTPAQGKTTLGTSLVVSF